MRSLNPIFIISLPRSGSTLLQRILTTSPEVHSLSETWLLFPFAFMSQQTGIFSIYDHHTAFHAWDDLLKVLPRGKDDFRKAVKDFSLTLYSKMTPPGSIRYFIDKTPRYYLIAPFLLEVFPDAKFIFLFRHPLQVLASILTTWMKNRFFIYKHYIDIFGGPEALKTGYTLLQDRAICVQYNELVTNPEMVSRRICNYLQIDFQPYMIENFTKVNFNGRMGDHIGTKVFDHISTSPLEKWKDILNTHYRIWFSRKYIKSLGNEILWFFDTSVDETLREIKTIDANWKGSFHDLCIHSLSNMKRWINWDYLKKLFGSFHNRKPFFPYL